MYARALGGHRAGVAQEGQSLEARDAGGDRLIGVEDRGAGVFAVGHAVAVDVARALLALAGVGGGDAVVGEVEHAVAVVVGIASVARAVAVGVGAHPIGLQRAGVEAIVDAVRVGVGAQAIGALGQLGRVVEAVAVGIEIAGVALHVAIEVVLLGVGHHRAVVFAVNDAVVVSVVVAGVTGAVHVGVGLIGVGDHGAVVDGVGHPIQVAVGAAHVGQERIHVARHEGVAHVAHVELRRGHVEDLRGRLGELFELVEVERARRQRAGAEQQARAPRQALGCLRSQNSVSPAT